VSTLAAQQFVKPIHSNLSYYFKHFNTRNESINHVINLCYVRSPAALLTPQWHRPAEVWMKKPPGGKIIHSGQKRLPSQADPGDREQEGFVIKPHAYFFFMLKC